MWRIAKNSLVLNIGLCMLAGIVCVATYRMIWKAFGLETEYRAHQRTIRELTAKKEELTRRFAELQNPEAIEREAKEHLNLKRPGEGVVVVVPGARMAPEVVSVRPWPRFVSWLQKFFHE